MRYFLILFALIATFISAEAKIPNFIQPCRRNDPEMSQCILDSINRLLKNELLTGIPELQIRTIDPLHIDILKLDLGRGISAVGRDLIFTGAKNVNITNFVADLDADTYTFDMTIPNAGAQGSYEIDTQIAAIHLTGKGPINMKAKSVSGKVKLQGSKVIRDGKTRYYFSGMQLKSEVFDYEIKLENLFEGAPEIGEILNKLLNEEQDEVLKSVRPVIEKTLIDKALYAANKLVTPYLWDELLIPAS